MNIDDIIKSIADETSIDKQKVKEIIDKYNEKVSEEVIKKLEEGKERKNQSEHVGPPRMETQFFFMFTNQKSNDL